MEILEKSLMYLDSTAIVSSTVAGGYSELFAAHAPSSALVEVRSLSKFHYYQLALLVTQ
jgi:hypothetical protein